jgi:hypothetical protein
VTPTKTPFAGFERLAPGDPLSSDSYALQYLNPLIADKLAKIGAVTHRHDAHAPMPDPGASPTAIVAATGGVIASGTPIHITYTLYDAAAGETLPAPATVVTTGAGYQTPDAPPTTSVDYSTGALLAGNPLYAITVTDGAGGETALGPAASVTIDPGHAHARVALSGLTALTDAASGGASGAGWRLWRSMDGGSDYDLLATGTRAADTFTDAGAGGDCTVSPPTSGTTVGTGRLTVTVASAEQPTGVTFFSIYADTTGTFAAPCLLGTYPATDFDVAKTYTTLVAQTGQPPAVSQSYPGAGQLNPDTDLLDWHWKRPVDAATSLPMTGNGDGDTRVTLDTNLIWIWDAGTGVWSQWNPAGASLISSQRTTSYTLAITDAGTVVEFTAAGAATLTIPANVIVGFPVGTVVEVFQYGAGQVTVAPAAGVTLRSDGAHVKTAAQYATISLRQRDIDEWVLSGDLA